MTHHRSHVLLLPQGASWEWYEAIRDYLLRFRPTVTHSADDAVSFRGAACTITVIHPASWNRPGVPRQPNQEDDIIAWLNDPKNNAGAEFDIDVIRSTEPAMLKRVLAERILQADRFGKRATAATAAAPKSPAPAQPAAAPAQPPAPAVKPEQQKLTLVWPSDFKVYTQNFGKRPEFYGKFGLPGHEGVDIRAPNGSSIYACADGVVSRVGMRYLPDGREHAYGYQIRIRHKRIDGDYETIYAHLQDGSARVKEGDTVTAGQPIAQADNTGNSQAPHLHLSLKKSGATQRGETNYPHDLVNPEPFFVDAPE